MAHKRRKGKKIRNTQPIQGPTIFNCQVYRGRNSLTHRAPELAISSPRYTPTLPHSLGREIVLCTAYTQGKGITHSAHALPPSKPPRPEPAPSLASRLESGFREPDREAAVRLPQSGTRRSRHRMATAFSRPITEIGASRHPGPACLLVPASNLLHGGQNQPLPVRAGHRRQKHQTVRRNRHHAA